MFCNSDLSDEVSVCLRGYVHERSDDAGQAPASSRTCMLLESLRGNAATDGFRKDESKSVFFGHVRHILSAISFVGAYLLKTRILPAYARDDFEAGLPVVDVDACGEDIKDVSLTVHDDVTLYSLDLLETVHALGRVRQTAPAARAVYETNRGALVSPRPGAGMSEKSRMGFIKQSRRVPVPPLVVDRFPMVMARRKQPPLATAAYKIHHVRYIMASRMSIGSCRLTHFISSGNRQIGASLCSGSILGMWI